MSESIVRARPIGPNIGCTFDGGGVGVRPLTDY